MVRAFFSALRPSRGVTRAVMVAGLLGAAGCPLFAQKIASESAASGATDFLQDLPASWKFVVTTLGFGGIAGWSVGYTLKKVAKLAALLIGVVVIALQFLAFQKLITIDWQRIQQSVPESSMEQAWAGLMSVLAYNMPFAGAFAVGMFMGFRSG